MSWLEDWARSFVERRAEKESFEPARHSFYAHSPIRQFVQLVFTGYLKDTFYMKKEEIYVASRQLHHEVAVNDPDFHLACLKLARQYGMMKDQVLIGILTRLKPTLNALRKDFDEYVELLATFPPNQLLKKFIEPLRRKEFGCGLGSYAKKLVRAVLDKWHEQGKLEYYLVRYPRAMRDIINLVHYPLPREDYANYLFRRNLDKVQAPYLRGALEFENHVNSKEYAQAGFIAKSLKLPFEVIRNRIPKSAYTYSEVQEAILATLTPHALALNAVPLAIAGIPEERLAEKIESVLPSSKVTSFEILRAAFAGAYRLGRNSPVVSALAKAYAAKVAKTWQEAIDIANFKVAESVVLVLDASASMYPGLLEGYFVRSLIALAPLAPRIKHLVLFSNYADYETVDYLKSFEGLLQLNKHARAKYGGGTCITDGLVTALHLVRSGEVDTVILSTDEQANIQLGENTEAEVVEKIVQAGAKVIIHNPSPYPAHIAKPVPGATYIYGDRAEAIIGSLRAQALRDMEDNQVKELIFKLVEATEK